MIESMDTSHFKMLNRGRGRGVLVDNFHNDGIVKMGGGGGGGEYIVLYNIRMQLPQGCHRKRFGNGRWMAEKGFTKLRERYGRYKGKLKKKERSGT